GKLHRSTASSIAFVVEGEGRTVFGDREIGWGRHDAVAIPNWTWHRHVNSSNHDALLFTLSDSPILTALGFYREETEDGEAMSSLPSPPKLSAAE
ncbi:MAG: 1-hydroxy-2-naphthoate dioxygenase, partial [Alphaproteobacteria bacterium]|nr:1-hydroxy-2-naphthoate dioxygenase [Alphaproteobacteria bacterium]